jgi:hypothetical protein
MLLGIIGYPKSNPLCRILIAGILTILSWALRSFNNGVIGKCSGSNN